MTPPYWAVGAGNGMATAVYPAKSPGIANRSNFLSHDIASLPIARKTIRILSLSPHPRDLQNLVRLVNQVIGMKAFQFGTRTESPGYAASGHCAV